PLHRVVNHRDRLEQPLSAQAAAVGDQRVLALEIRAWSLRSQDLIDRGACGLSRGDAVQQREVASKRRKRDGRLGAGGIETGKLAHSLLGVATADLVDKILHGDLCAVADDLVDILSADALVAG